jgi:hypothetical protein
MWILRFLYCCLDGHAFVDTTSSSRPYRFCVRCGKIKEPAAFLKSSRKSPGDPIPVRVTIH